MEQLPLFTFSKDISNSTNLLISDCNREAISLLRDSQLWSGKFCLLEGPAKSGRSTIAKFWAEENKAVFLSKKNLPFVDELLLRNSAFVLDDFENIASDKNMLFLLQKFSDRDKTILFVLIKQWKIKISSFHIRSRLLASPSAKINNPDDIMIRQLLLELLKQYGIKAEEDFIKYLACRVPRSFISVNKMADHVNHLVNIHGYSPVLQNARFFL